MARVTVAAMALMISAGASAQTTIPRGQLPGTVKPLAYRLDVRIDPATERFSGHVEIAIATRSRLQTLFLNGKELHVTSARVRTGRRIDQASYEQVDPIGVARLRLAAPMAPGRHVLVIDYDASLVDNGLFRSRVAGDWYAWSAFEPAGARTAFPGFDEPRFKTPFTLSVEAPAPDLVISNARETGAEKHGSTTRHIFATTAPLPTYLVQIAVGPFATGSTVAAPTAWRRRPLPIRAFATRDKKDKLAFALANMGPIERLIEAYVGQPYPFAKLDAVATPEWSGSALEDAGAILFADDVFLGSGGADPAFVSRFAADVPHEISHQWFGDLVTPRWWDDLWLNESFASWLGMVMARQWQPGVKIGGNDTSLAFTAMNLDSLAAVDALQSPVPTPDDQRFTPITYGKGAQVVRMMASYLGDTRFRDGVRRYLAAHRFGTARAEDFFSALGAAARDPLVVRAMRDFVEQRGVPLVTITRQGNRIAVHQSHYQMLGSTLTPRTWAIPFCYRVATARHCAMLASDKALLPSGAGVLMPNAGGNGYYRFALQPEDWRRLLQGAPSLSTDEALAAADSLWAQYRAGTLDSAVLLEGFASLAHHADAGVALSGARALAHLRASGFLQAAQLPALGRYIRALYLPRLRALGFDPAEPAADPGQTDRQQQRADLLAILVDAHADADLEAELSRAVDQGIAGKALPLNPAYRLPAFKAWLRVHGLAHAQIFYDRMVKGSTGTLHIDALKALSATGDTTTGRWLLQRTTADALPARDQTIILTGLSAWPQTRLLAYDRALALDGARLADDDDAAHRMLNLTAEFCSASDDAHIEQDLRPRMVRGGPGAVRFSRLRETAHDCATLAGVRQADFARALDLAGTPQG